MAGPHNYRVDMKLVLTGTWAEYTSKRKDKILTLAMACSYANHLRRSKTAGRIVEVSTDRVQAEWTADGTPVVKYDPKLPTLEADDTCTPGRK